METRQLFRLRPIDWRWIIVSYCFLVLFHLFPSFLITGWTNTYAGPVGFLSWLTIGMTIVCAVIGVWSRGITILEPGVASTLYAFTLIGGLQPQWMFGRGFRSTAWQIVLLLSMFVVGCLGAAFGGWLQMRKEKKRSV
ncbi:MAG: hypothetical protein NTU47_03065 [Ignavibacteriales bacterium]|nr:hypothetical protein [Ignavibacteriales bacterium]